MGLVGAGPNRCRSIGLLTIDRARWNRGIFYVRGEVIYEYATLTTTRTIYNDERVSRSLNMHNIICLEPLLIKIHAEQDLRTCPVS